MIPHKKDLKIRELLKQVFKEETGGTEEQKKLEEWGEDPKKERKVKKNAVAKAIGSNNKDQNFLDAVAKHPKKSEGDLVHVSNLRSGRAKLKKEGLEEGSVAHFKGKVVFSGDMPGNRKFVVRERDTTGMRGSQDKFMMGIESKDGKVLEVIGSHPSLSGAKKYGQNRHGVKLNEEQLDEAKKPSNPFDYHQLAIAKKTLKMHDVGARIMGGMTKEQARQILRKNGWSDKKIADYEGPKGRFDEELESKEDVSESYYRRGSYRQRTFKSPDSALRAASKSNPRNQPCPTCKEPNKLTPKDVRLGYQCDDCADRQERGF